MPLLHPHAPRRRTLTRLLAGLGVAAVVLYGAAVLFLVWREPSLVFLANRRVNAPPAGFAPTPIVREYRGADESRQTAVEVPATRENGPDAPGAWVLFFHGNGGNVSHGWPRYAQFSALGLHVLAPEYTGYGGLPGSPSEAALAANATAAYRYLRDARGVPSTSIVLYGYSLGSCVAVELASRVEVGALVLEGAIASVVGTAARRYPIFPVRLLMRNRFESDARIGHVTAPVLFIHSPDDRQVPIEDSRRLFALTNAPKQFLEVRGGHRRAHLEDETVYLDGLMRFLNERMDLSGRRASRP